MGRLLGKNIAIWREVNGVRRVIGLSTACNVDLDTEMVEYASLASAFRSYRPGKSGGTISIERLFDAGGGVPMMYLQMQRTPLMYAVEVDGLTISGEAYISSQSAAAPVGGYATHRVTLTCTGEIAVDAGYIDFVDAEVARICNANWGDGIGINASMAGDVKTIGTVFYNNKKIANFNELALFTGLTALESYAFYYCSGLREVAMPDSVTSVGGRVFEGCSVLESVTLSRSLTNIGNYMFSGCQPLRTVILSESINRIGLEAFQRCLSLTEIDIPAGVTSIGDRAFAGCASLSSITVRSTTPPTLGANAFSGISGNARIKVPADVYDTYRYATNWSEYRNIIIRL